MDDDQIKTVVGAAGDDMPATSRASIRAGLAQALHHTTTAEPDGPESGGSVVSIDVAHEARTRRPRGRWMAVTGAGAVAAAAIVAFAVGRNTDPEPTTIGETIPSAVTSTEPSMPSSADPVTTQPATTDSTTSTADAPSTSVSPTTTVPSPLDPVTGLTLPANVVPTTVSFPTALDGWMVGSYTADDTPESDSSARTVLLHTTDGGHTWTEVNNPLGMTDDASAYSIAFADEMNGWLAGPIVNGIRPVLLTTHDGAATWSRALGPGNMAWSPMSVAAANGLVTVVAFDEEQTLGVFTSRVDDDAFVRSPVALQTGAGPVYDATISLGGSSGWLVYNDRVLTGAARLVGGQWVDWQTPCSTTAPSQDVADVASSPDGATVVVSCTTSGFADPPVSIRLYMSTDGGASFTETTPVENGTQDAQSRATPSVSFVAAPAAGAIVVGYTRNDGGVVIISSADGGTTWTNTQHVADDQTSGWLFEFAVPGDGSGAVVVATSPTAGLGSVDGGRTWTVVFTANHLSVATSSLAQIDLDSGQLFGFDAGNAPDTNSPTPEDFLAVATPVLGQPDLDTGWYTVPLHPYADGSQCWGGATARVLIWGDLSLLFVDDGTHQFLTNWQVGGADYPARGIDLVVTPPVPHPSGLLTVGFGGDPASEFGLGSSITALAADFPQYAPRGAGGQVSGFGGLNNSMYVATGEDGDTITRIAVENGC